MTFREDTRAIFPLLALVFLFVFVGVYLLVVSATEPITLDATITGAQDDLGISGTSERIRNIWFIGVPLFLMAGGIIWTIRRYTERERTVRRGPPR